MDIISDGITKIRNAQKSKASQVLLKNNKVVAKICGILKKGGYIIDYNFKKENKMNFIEVVLKYDKNDNPIIKELVRVSKNSRRVYKPANDIPRIANGYATVIMSTPKGVITGREAKQENVGGEVICYVL